MSRLVQNENVENAIHLRQDGAMGIKPVGLSISQKKNTPVKKNTTKQPKPVAPESVDDVLKDILSHQPERIREIQTLSLQMAELEEENRALRARLEASSKVDETVQHLLREQPSRIREIHSLSQQMAQKDRENEELRARMAAMELERSMVEVDAITRDRLRHEPPRIRNLLRSKLASNYGIQL
ncbi:hypothetical protein PROFUN_05700 [Planoprotostelium fungivorum]|uniref:Uncharacterized protein n=1 Tax=Planoprotostelium fungivorum TaxID=1890364 RepID=A0A2P6NQG3_9EUKA|nr:hypothetical protein PROFUN_05700 [Planoprotostelium fungivorum]